LPVQKNVARLQIAMDHTALVCEIQCHGNLPQQRVRFDRRETPRRHCDAESFGVHVLHRHEGFAALINHFKDRDNARMRQRPGLATRFQESLPLETPSFAGRLGG
jgi:hypothetical protein